MRTALFESFDVHFNIPLELKFKIFDFPAAQKWAALLSAHVSLHPSSRRFSTRLFSPPQITMAAELEKALLDLEGDQELQDFLRDWRGCSNRLSAENKKNILDHIQRLQQRVKVSHDEWEHWRLEDVAIRVEQTFWTTRLAPRASFRCSADILGWQGYESVNYPMANEDLRHFRNDRMAGGVRLVGGKHLRSPIECAELGELNTPPRQIRHLSPSFRVDLAKRYPAFTGSGTERRFHLWKQMSSFGNQDPASWGHYFYVAQLADEHFKDIEEMAQHINSCADVSIVKISMNPAS